MTHVRQLGIVVFVGLAGCPKRTVDEAGSGLALDRPVVREVEPMRSTVPSPGTWSGAGLVVDVPAGWIGREGRGSGLVLSLGRSDGVALEVWSFDPAENVPFPRPREGCEPLFTDKSTYRSLPGLPVSATSSCVPDAAAGVVVDGWYAEVNGRQLQIDLLLPSDRVIEGRDAVAPILASIRVASEAP